VHCLDAVHHQIDDDLLQLDSIGVDHQRNRRKLHTQRQPGLFG